MSESKQFKISLHPKQMEVYQDKHRFKVVAAGRRFGKCVAQGTLVFMADGSMKRVEDVAVGDEVLSFNLSKIKIEARKVVASKCNGVKKVYKVSTHDREILVTDNHPFLKGWEWTETKDLKIGNRVCCISIWDEKIVEWRQVDSVEYVGEKPTYDIEVEDNHNFIANGFITHNSYLSRVEMISAAIKPNQKVWYVAPTYRMAKQIMWGDLIDALPKEWIVKLNETNLTVELANGSRIELKGADKPDSLRGVGLNFLVLDEFQDFREETWTRVLRPTLADKKGSALFIGTPRGANAMYKLYKLGQPGGSPDWKSWQFPTISSPFIPYAELEAAKRDMDEKSFRQEFEADFSSMAGRVYYPFSRAVHIRHCPFNPKLPIWVGMDFNIDPMSAVILQPQANGEVWAVSEIVKLSSNTEEMCQELERRYYRWQERVIIFPDPAGGARQHARGESDLDIMKEHGFTRIKYRRQHPPVADRVNAVNRMLMSAKGEIKLFVDPSCTHLINALEQTVYIEKTREVDKSANIEHSADALGYAIEIQYPVRRVNVAGFSR